MIAAASVVVVLATSASALATGYSLMAWGEGSTGELGNGATLDTTVPVGVSGVTTAKAVSTAYSNTYVILQSGRMLAWGSNVFGELADGSTTDSDVPVEVPGLEHVKQVSAGGNGGVALLESKAVVDWGNNKSGQLGIGEASGPETCSAQPCSTTPVEVQGLAEFGSEVVAVSAGVEHNLALLANGSVLAWGSNEYGQLGDGTTEGVPVDSSLPVEVQGLEGEAVAVAAGYKESLALMSDGRVMAWGENSWGQLGINESSGPETCVDPPAATRSCSTKPVEVQGLSELESKVVAISGGYYYNFALLEDGTVMGWGANYSGELGIGESTGPSTCPASGTIEEPCSMLPVHVVGVGGSGHLGGVVEVFASKTGHTAAARLSDGTVATWGENNDSPGTNLRLGGLGIGKSKGPETCGIREAACSTTPVIVSRVVDARALSAGGTGGIVAIDPDSPPEYGRCLTVDSGAGRFGDSACTEEGTGERAREWYPGVVSHSFGLSSSTKVVLETTAKEKMECTGMTGSGEYAGRQQVSGVTMTFTGCFIGTSTKCHSPFLSAGEVKTSTLKGELGWESLSGHTVAIALTPTESGGPVIPEYTCGVATAVVKGGVLGKVTTGTMQLSPTIKFVQSSGVQEPQAFEAGPTTVLERSVLEFPAVQAGLKLSAKQSNEEKLEVNAIV